MRACYLLIVVDLCERLTGHLHGGPEQPQRTVPGMKVQPVTKCDDHGTRASSAASSCITCYFIGSATSACYSLLLRMPHRGAITCARIDGAHSGLRVESHRRLFKFLTPHRAKRS